MAETNGARSLPRKQSTKGSTVYPWVLVFWSVYLFAVYNTPNETVMSAFDITERTAVILRFTVAVPYLLMWLVIAYAYVRLITYADIIKKSKESVAFRRFAQGTAVLLTALIFTAIIASIRSIVDTDTRIFNIQLEPLLTIIVNYGYTLPYAVAFGLFFLGTHQLRAKENIAFNSRRFIAFAIPLIALAYMWLEIIFTSPTRDAVAGAQVESIYYLRDSLLILTIIIPSIFSWVLGATAVSNIRSYQLKINGVIYKKALRYFVLGLTGMTLGSILLQSLHSLGTEQLIGLGLEMLLGVIYAFLAIQSFGFVFMALGAKQLTKIETV